MIGTQNVCLRPCTLYAFEKANNSIKNIWNWEIIVYFSVLFFSLEIISNWISLDQIVRPPNRPWLLFNFNLSAFRYFILLLPASQPVSNTASKPTSHSIEYPPRSLNTFDFSIQIRLLPNGPPNRQKKQHWMRNA